jgi:hypothetical protein
VALSADSLQKNTEKYQFVVVTDIVKEADAHNLLNLSWRNSKTYFTVDMGFNPNVAVLDLICSTFFIIQAKNLSLESREETSVNPLRLLRQLPTME